MAKSKHVNNPWGGFFFVLPSILAMVIFVYGMIGWTVNVSFGKRVNAYTNAKGYVGFKNYKDFIQAMYLFKKAEEELKTAPAAADVPASKQADAAKDDKAADKGGDKKDKK